MGINIDIIKDKIYSYIDDHNFSLNIEKCGFDPCKSPAYNGLILGHHPHTENGYSISLESNTKYDEEKIMMDILIPLTKDLKSTIDYYNQETKSEITIFFPFKKVNYCEPVDKHWSDISSSSVLDDDYMFPPKYLTFATISINAIKTSHNNGLTQIRFFVFNREVCKDDCQYFS